MISACDSLKKLCGVGRTEQDGIGGSSICGLVALAAQQALEVMIIGTMRCIALPVYIQTSMALTPLGP